jgi:hypothetical protein
VYVVGAPVPVADIAALTDDRGRFAMSVPSLGSYQLGVSAEGSAGTLQKTTEVKVGEGGHVDLEVRLES